MSPGSVFHVIVNIDYFPSDGVTEGLAIVVKNLNNFLIQKNESFLCEGNLIRMIGSDSLAGLQDPEKTNAQK